MNIIKKVSEWFSFIKFFNQYRQLAKIDREEFIYQKKRELESMKIAMLELQEAIKSFNEFNKTKKS